MAGKVGFSDFGAAAPCGGLGGALAAGAVEQVPVWCLGRAGGEATHEGGVQGREVASSSHLSYFWASYSSLSVFLASPSVPFGQRLR